ncbi:nuclease-related domain-containing protein [Caldalkalibacillus mannanilyticus]|uniref:nuclease-related domain-containing protein n=1 Tax=Caldalkalibacillus mannanilyticus TaxID=1418 RepID=UPI000469D45C|nr:nuclease-related domain-containing protein [Caldalkalibacillus mannanilyticus]
MFSKLISKLLKNDIKEKVSPKPVTKKEKTKVAPTRIGELGEYKIDIQLDQLPKNYRYLSDVLLPNKKSKSGYSQVDHIVLTPYAIFVIETKNYAGTIYGDRNRAKWSVNGKFPMLNPFNQNYGHILAVKSFLDGVEDTNVVSMISFNRRATFKVNEELRKIQSNDLIVYDTELSDFIARKINIIKMLNLSALFSDEVIIHMYNVLSKANITDPSTREQHVEKINELKDQKVDANASTEVVNCDKCGKVVSAKIKAFCLSNKNRFDGKIYCFEHQK